MKKISEHLGAIVVALAAVALLITAITFFKAPLSTFFNSIITTETGVGDKLLNGLDDVDAPSLSGGGSGGGGGSSVTMLDGDGQTVNKQFLANSVIFRSSAPISEFQSVKVNGTVVDSSNYTLVEGSTIVIFNADYIQTLAAEEHSIDIVSESGTASADFTVVNTDIIPEGGTYYKGVPVCLCGQVNYREDCPLECGERYDEGTAYTAGQAFPEFEVGDVFVYGDYVYYAEEEGNGWSVGLNLRETSYEEESYGDILSIINNVPVQNLWMVYTTMGTFQNCTNLKVAPVIPSSVTNMESSFYNCSSLEEVPNIPNSVKYLCNTFYGCTSLTGTLKIPENFAYGDSETVEFMTSVVRDTNVEELIFPCDLYDYCEENNLWEFVFYEVLGEVDRTINSYHIIGCAH